MTNGTFTKTYNVQPTEVQRKALAQAFKKIIEGYCLQGSNVNILVEDGSNLFDTKKGSILVTMAVENNPALTEVRYIGTRGGIKTV